jgi:hypothetical protein
MSSLVFLAIAVGVSVLGTAVLWLFSREHRSYDSSINDFRKNMGALAPPDEDKKSSRRGP